MRRPNRLGCRGLQGVQFPGHPANLVVCALAGWRDIHGAASLLFFRGLLQRPSSQGLRVSRTHKPDVLHLHDLQCDLFSAFSRFCQLALPLLQLLTRQIRQVVFGNIEPDLSLGSSGYRSEKHCIIIYHARGAAQPETNSRLGLQLEE